MATLLNRWAGCARRLAGLFLAWGVGCQAAPPTVPADVEARVAEVSPARASVDAVRCEPEIAPPAGPLNQAALWELALQVNPSLREAAADVEAAAGQQRQAGTYPNPRFAYSQESLGTHQNALGAMVYQVQQEIVTGGKRRLDLETTGRGLEGARIALLGRKFDVLTRVRRAYYEYLAWWYTLRASQQVVATLEKGVDISRKQVELQLRPRTDLLRLEAVLQEAQITLARNRLSRDAAWGQLVAEVGAADLPMPAEPEARPNAPEWDEALVRARVLAANSSIKLAAIEAEQARLMVARAQADAIPNVTIGAGYNRNFAENEVGAVLSLETPLPLWDRKQGKIHEAEARFAKAQAARQATVNHLRHDLAEVFGRYQAALRQERGLLKDVLPRLEKNLELVRAGYERGGQITFADVLLAQESLNDTRLRLEDVRRELWRAVAELQGLMQLDLDEELGPGESQPPAAPGCRWNPPGQ
jgi:cobalt-zinc-cadmium efflux system outer membrane protein